MTGKAALYTLAALLGIYMMLRTAYHLREISLAWELRFSCLMWCGWAIVFASKAIDAFSVKRR